jgi:RHS repeat-associated protein
MATVTIEKKDNAGTLLSKTVNTYDYDSSGIRIGVLTEIDSDGVNGFDSRTRIEHLVDKRNFTGYAQTIRETEYDADTGNVIKVTDYTFGHDEISQRTVEFNAQGNVTSDVTLIFGHDRHGSVRVLFDAMAVAVQLFVYDAYGVMHAIYDGAGNFVSASASAALTNLLYSGEKTDATTGLQYLRARYYDPNTGGFNRLDPFFGNLNDPQSLHKYAYALVDPINGFDPTGQFTAASTTTSSAISSNISTTNQITITSVLSGGLKGALIGGVIGGVSGGIDGYLARGNWGDARAGAISGAKWGAGIGFLTGGLGAWFGPAFQGLSQAAKIRVIKGLLVIDLISTGYSVWTAESTAQGLFRGGTGLLGALSSLIAIRNIQASSVSTPSPTARYRNLARSLDTYEGHSFAKHGAHVTPDQHYLRLTEGIAPGGTPGKKPDFSSSFASDKTHVDAYERALYKMWENPTKSSGGWKKAYQFTFDMEDAGRAYRLDGSGNLDWQKSDTVFAWFKMVPGTENDPIPDYYLFTMYPKP